MLTEQRYELILRLLEDKKSITVAEVRDLLRTSESTVRRDLNTLDANGQLVKVHGGAILKNTVYSTIDDEVVHRKEQNREAKDKIAAIAKQCVAIAREKYGYVRCADLKGNINCSEIIAFMAKTAEDIMKKEKN